MCKTIKSVVAVLLFLLIIFGFGIGQTVLPDKTASIAERRELSDMPAFDVKKLKNGRLVSEIESYLLDQFLLRDTFRSIKALSEYGIFFKGDNNGLYLRDGFICKAEYPKTKNSAEQIAEKFTAMYENVFSGKGEVYYTVIPDKNHFLSFRCCHPTVNYNGIFAEFSKALPARFHAVKISDLLTAADFYKTDIHWRQECITDVADRLLEQMNASKQRPDYKTNTLSPFFGAYYGQAALPVPPDNLLYLSNNTLDDCTVYNPLTKEKSRIYRTDLFGQGDSYNLFLSGPQAVLIIENPHNNSSRELYIIRDSFASSLAPLLIESYSRIVLIDPRYISDSSLQRRLPTPQGDCDILFIMNTVVMNRSYLFK